MKKLLLIMLTVLMGMSSLSLSAQSTLTVADGTTTNSYVPVYGLYVDDFVRCQTIYPAGMLADLTGESILGLVYYLSTPAAASWGSATFVVNIMEVADTALTGFVDMSNATLVYSGSLDATQSTMEINFAFPYTYMGGNLLIEIYNTLEGTYKSASFYGITATGASWQGYNGTSVENITGSTRAFIPKTTFLYGNPPTCFKVTNQNIDAAQTTSTSLTLTWVDTINTGATYEIYDMSDTSLVAAGINDYSYTVMNLTSNTAYTLGIQTNCGGGDIANGYAIVNGRTACDLVTTLPWTDDLEAVPSGDYQMPFCWNRYTSAFTTTTTYPYSYSSSTYAHGGTRSLYFYGTTGDAYPDTMIAITPEFDVITYPMNENRVSFWARMGTASNSKNIYVGTMTDPTDPTTFTLADSILVSGNVYTKYNVALTNVTGSYVAFVVYKGAGTMYVDDITLEVAPSCLEVTNLAVSATSTNSITLTWNDNHNPDGTGYTVYNMADTSDVNATINGNSALIENLDANTLYTFGVESNCASGDDAAIVTVSGRTECDVFTAPYTWTFEDMTASAAPLCWTKIGTGTVNVMSSTTNSHDGTMYVRFSGSTSNLVALPETQDEIGTLRLRFWTRPESYTNTSCGNFSVGYITDITDATTFVEVANYVYNDFSAYEEKTVTFAGAPAGARMAMRHNAGSTSWYWYIDDVTIEEAPDCLPISGLTVSDITTTDATLSWTGDANSYVVYDMSDTSVVASGVSATTYDLSGLDAMTSYTYGVAAECGADISPIVSVAFNTACTAVSLPYTETFESTSASRECWTLFGYGNLSGSTGMGFVTINGHEALRFSSYSNADDYNQYGFSPLMDVNPTATNLLVNVVYATYGANDKLNFGYITETDTIWFTTEYTTSGSNDWQSVDIIIPASATQFAIHYYGNYSYYAWIDTIAVSEMVGDFCYAVNDLTVDDVTENSVTISWTDENNSGATYTILNLTDTTVVATGLTSTSYDILGLDPMTLYTFGVVANCSSSDVSDMVTVSALTLCVAVAIPFTEGFEMDSPTLGCWSLANTAANTGLNTSNPYTGSVAFIFAYNTNPPQYLFSPELSGTENGLLVSFMYSVQSTSFPESFQLGYSTTTNDTAAFTWGVEQTNLTNLTYEEYSEILPAGVKYVCIKYTANNMYFLYIDDVTFMTPPSCLPVSDLTVDTATSNSVTISWTGTAASYDLYNGETFVANVTGNTYTFNGLSASFNYTFGVQAICSATDTAAMVTVSASTDCGLITNYPYVQDFTVAPACWMALDADGDGNNWILYNGTIQSASYSGGALTPDNWLISPQFAIPATGNYEVTWTATAQNQSWPAEHYGIFVSTTGYSDTANFTMLQEWTLSTGIFNPVVDLSAYSGQNIYIALRHFNCTDQYSLSIDEFIVREQAGANQVTINAGPNNPAYGTVTGGGIYNIGDNVTMTATPSSGYTFSKWVDGNNTILSTDNPYTFVAATDLTLTAIFLNDAGTTYTITVLVNDSTMGIATGGGTYTAGDQITLVATPFAGYNFVNWTQVSSFGTNEVGTDPTLVITVTGDKTFMANFESGSTPIQYTVTLNTADATMGSVSPAGATTVDAGSNFTATATANTGYQFVAWMDGTTQVSQANPYTFAVNSNITLTAAFAAIPEPCDVPTGLTVGTVTHESIAISWDANANVSSWDIQYRPVGGTLNSATATTNSYTITGLAPETEYQIQVQANCSNGQTSEWTAAVNATTLTGINNHLLNSIALYPNPANDVINVQCTMYDVQMVEVIDVYGKLIQTINVTDNLTSINVSNLASGMYFVRVTTEEGTATKSFVKK